MFSFNIFNLFFGGVLGGVWGYCLGRFLEGFWSVLGKFWGGMGAVLEGLGEMLRGIWDVFGEVIWRLSKGKTCKNIVKKCSSILKHTKNKCLLSGVAGESYS